MQQEPELPELSSLEGELLGGKYVVESVLGHGGMGVVFRARDVGSHQLVAIKVLRQELVGSEEAVARFDREARASVALSSEHVARIFDVGRTSAGAPFIVMEHLVGKNLSTLVDERALGMNAVLDIALEVCEALTEAHARGIIHRDLKPANVFVVEDPNGRRWAKVLDFGIAKVDGSTFGGQALTTTGSMIGTPWYMPPEQLDTRFGVTPKADVWSLGATLYNALTGRTPYEAESFFELSVKVYTNEPTPIERHRSDLPPEVVALIHGCLQKDVARRLALPDVIERLLHLRRARESREDGASAAAEPPITIAPVTPTVLAHGAASRAPISATIRMTPQPDVRKKTLALPAAELLGGMATAATQIAPPFAPPSAPVASLAFSPARIGAAIALAAVMVIAGILMVLRLRHPEPDPLPLPAASAETPPASSAAAGLPVPDPPSSAAASAPTASVSTAQPSVTSQPAQVTPRPGGRRPAGRPTPPGPKPDPSPPGSGGALTHER